MILQKLGYKEHIIELKSRLIKILIFYVCSVGFSYLFIERIYNILLIPIQSVLHNNKIIYTNLTEVFLTYLSLSLTTAAILTLPWLNFQIYQFLKPALYPHEKKVALIILLCSPILFIIGASFAFFVVIPKAWAFFIGFEQHNNITDLILEAKISEYVNLISEIIIAFGIAFELPIILLILILIKVISRESLIKKRRLAIVINFIIAAILTPPDVMSQFALAIPLIVLYEISIFTSKFIVGNQNAESKMDS